MNLNRQDLINAVAEQSALTKTQAKSAVTAALDTITHTLAGHGEVRIHGFGTFTVRERAERVMTGPIAGGKVVPAHHAPVFRPTQALKDAVK